ncbi:MAG: hypothetical protein ACU0BF_04715 [Paracoccaceae bacterium]
MRHPSLSEFLRKPPADVVRGPTALVLAEDGVEIASTVAHLQRLAFGAILVLAPATVPLPEGVHGITFDTRASGAMPRAVNALIAAAPGAWLHYCYNAEYLFYPFCETRRVGELTTFVTEERRDSVLTYVVDLYADDLAAHPSAVCREAAHLDRSGYYALARTDAWNNPQDRQMDFFGGLRWRFEEHVPPARRRIDRVGLVRAIPGARIRDDHTFEPAELNTYACEWHHSPTAAICSFRAAKALRRNPDSRDAIDSFVWRGSAPFDWSSAQLLNLGLMEPGQWF